MSNNDKSIQEINEVIAKVEKAVKPKCEVGTRDSQAILKSLLKDPKKKVKFFPCRREHSGKILSHFVKKGIPKNKFSIDTQSNVYLVY